MLSDEEWLKQRRQQSASLSDEEWLKQRRGDFVSNIPKDENEAAQYARDYGIPDDSNEKGIIGKTLDYLQKPSDAVAGVIVHGLQTANDTWRNYLAENPEKQAEFANPVQIYNIPAPTDANVIAAASRGWDKGASYTEAMDKDWVKANPVKAGVTDFVAKVGIDPLNVLSPSNIVRGVYKAGEATGINSKVIRAADALAETVPGRFIADKANAVLDAHPLNSDLSVRQWFSESKKTGDLQDARTRYLAETEDAVRNVTNDLQKTTKPMGDRGSEFEKLVGRYQESLSPDGISPAKLEGRKAVFESLNRELLDAKNAVNEAKGIEQLTEAEQRVAQILKDRGIQQSELPNVLKALDDGFEVSPKSVVTNGIDPLVKPKAEALRLIASGKMTPEEYARSIQMFSPDEIRFTLPEMKRKNPGNKILTEIEQGAVNTPIGITLPASKLERDVLEGIGKQNPAIIEPLPTGTRTPLKWEEVLTAGEAGKLTPDQLQNVKGILTEDEFNRFMEITTSKTRTKQSVFESAMNGAIHPSDVLKYQDLFTSAELRQIGEKMANNYPKFFGISQNENVRKLIYGIKEAVEKKAVEEVRIKDALAKGLKADIDKPIKDVNINIANNLDSNIKAELPNMFQAGQKVPDGSGVLPKVNIASVPKTALQQLGAKGVDLRKLSQSEVDALRSVDPRDVPKLQEKITQVADYNKKINHLEAAERALTRADVSPETTVDVIKAALDGGFSPEEVAKIADFGQRMKKIAGSQTMEALQLKLISLDTAGEFSDGRHLRRMYSSIDTPKQHYDRLIAMGKKAEAIKFLDAARSLDKAARKSNLSLDLTTVIERQNLPKSIQDAYGRIYEASLPFARGSQLSAELIANQRLLKGVMERYAVDGADLLKTPNPEKYVQFKPTGDGKWGPLEGMYVPKDVYGEVAYALKNQPPGVWQQSVGVWKSLKTVWNPASWSRNAMSNLLLMDINGIPLPQAMRYSFEAANEMKTKGKWFEEARRETNLLLGTFMRNELGKTMQRTGSETLLGKAGDAFKGATEKLGKWYNAVETNGKLATYMYARRSLGKSVKEAEAFANQVLFDYSKVPPIIEKLRNTGLVPFATFPYKASQSVSRQLYENPTRITKYYRAIEMADDKDQKRLMPDYQRTSLPIDKALQALGIDRTTRIVNGKEQKVQNRLDLKYILPFESGTDVGLSPAIGIIKGLAGNRDFLDRDIVRKGMEGTPQAWKARANFLYQSLAPSLAPPIPGGVSEGGYTWQKLSNAATGRVDAKGRQYDLGEAVAHGVLGLKNSPVNIEETYRNKVLNLSNDMKSTISEIGRTRRDRSLSDEQRAEREAEYKNKLKKLQVEIKQQRTAYDRLKAKEGR